MSTTIVGNGPIKVIALHGWFGASTGWGLLPELIDGNAYSYAFPDYRGYGERLDARGDYSLDEISTDVLSLADELGWSHFALLGHSMGGAAALRILVNAPDRVTAVVGVSPVPASGVPLDQQSRALFEGAAQDDANRRAIIDLTTGNRLAASWLDQMVSYSVEQSTRDAVGAYLTAWVDADFASELPARAIPVRVIVGENDPALGADAARATWGVQIPGTTIEVLAGAGHYAMFEAPVALMTCIEDALSASTTD